MKKIMNGESSEIFISSFLTSLKMKGEKKNEIIGFVKAIREASQKVNVALPKSFLDTCGTGGDGKNSINVSTLSAITLASLSVPVAKHGNRSVSSVCGSSDLLDEFGYKYTGNPDMIADRVNACSFTFLFAPMWHPAMKNAAPVRKELGFRTVFNLLGPLSNPLSPTNQIIGVYDQNLIELFAGVISELEIQSAIICHSLDGFDEFSIFQPTRYALIHGKDIQFLEFNPECLGLSVINSEEVFVSSRSESILLSEKVLKGENVGGLHKVALNSGVGLFLMNRAHNIKDGYGMALEKLKSGEVYDFFINLIQGSKDNPSQA